MAASRQVDKHSDEVNHPPDPTLPTTYLCPFYLLRAKATEKANMRQTRVDHAVPTLAK